MYIKQIMLHSCTDWILIICQSHVRSIIRGKDRANMEIGVDKKHLVKEQLWGGEFWIDGYFVNIVRKFRDE